MVVAAGILVVSPAASQNRVARPLQVHLDFGTALSGVRSRLTSTGGYDELRLGRWLPGISVGFHFSRYVFVGLSHRPSTRLRRRQSMTLANTESPVADLYHGDGPIQSVHVRVSPLRPGIFVMGGIVFEGSTSYSLRIPDRLHADWIAPAWRSFGVGGGYTHIFPRGISATAGVYRLLEGRPRFIRALGCIGCGGDDDEAILAPELIDLSVAETLVFFVGVGVNFYFPGR